MRSKEVNESINRLAKAQNSILEATLYSQEQQDEDIKTVLDYISELEEENKTQRGQLNSAFDNGFIHKDKIRDELKEFRDKAKTAKGIELLLLEANVNLLERFLAGK